VRNVKKLTELGKKRRRKWLSMVEQSRREEGHLSWT